MNIDAVTREMTRDLGPDPVLVLGTDAAGRTVALAVSSPAVLEELRELGVVIPVATDSNPTREETA
jgi:hypothetical protein